MKISKFSIFLFTISFSFPSFSQEVLLGLTEGTKIKGINNEKSLDDTLQLPFWDDFSYRTNLWQENDVFLNSTYTQTAPSIGIATFDLLDSEGKIYQDAAFDESFEADKLTSRPVDLSSGSNIYLSFYYRPQGLADAPETKDSLVLEFYSPLTGNWKKVWQSAGTFDYAFRFQAVPISEPEFKQKGFQFRFVNYGSFGSSIFPSLASNADQWHLDFVYLNKNRSAKDSVFHDAAFTRNLKSFLTEYEAMPWSHFLTNPQEFLKPDIELGIKNNDNIVRLLNRTVLTVNEKITNSAISQFEIGSQNLPRFNEITTEKNIPLSFPDNSEDSARFEISCTFYTDSYDSICNNTIRYEQIFKNYYAYDDGTAEAGYGLTGSGSKFGMLAYAFEPKKADGIIGVEIYFNKTYNDANNKYFLLNFWNDKNGFPDDTPFVSVSGIRPTFPAGNNDFMFYSFADTIYTDKKFYVGWQQTTDDFLNVGFDLNRQSNEHLFYNLGGAWKQSQIEGAVMIRPVFSGTYVAPQKKTTHQIPVKLYPQPVKQDLHIDIPPDYMAQIIDLRIFDLTGRVIYHNPQFQGSTIDVGKFRPGIYILRLKTDENFFSEQKFSVIK